MNPFIRLWQFSLAFLLAVVTVVCFPVSLLFSGTVALITIIARHRRNRRHAQYSWSERQPHQRSKSGYRRARYGRGA